MVGTFSWNRELYFADDSYPGQSHVPVGEARQPSGPFDFSAISPQQLHYTTSPGQVGVSSKQRAYTVPLVSPTIFRRNLGRLMPSPGKVSIVPPVHEMLRFSSLPCSPGPLADIMDVDKIVKLSEESERVRNPSKSSSPSHKGLDSSSCEAPIVEDQGLPSSSQLPSVAPGQEVIPSNPSNVSPSALPQSLDVRPFSVLAE
jgi:hypothetical protein